MHARVHVSYCVVVYADERGCVCLCVFMYVCMFVYVSVLVCVCVCVIKFENHYLALPQQAEDDNIYCNTSA